MMHVVPDSDGAAARITARLEDLLARLKSSARATRRGSAADSIHDTRVAVSESRRRSAPIATRCPGTGATARANAEEASAESGPRARAGDGGRGARRHMTDLPAKPWWPPPRAHRLGRQARRRAMTRRVLRDGRSSTASSDGPARMAELAGEQDAPGQDRAARARAERSGSRAMAAIASHCRAPPMLISTTRETHSSAGATGRSGWRDVPARAAADPVWLRSSRRR